MRGQITQGSREVNLRRGGGVFHTGVQLDMLPRLRVACIGSSSHRAAPDLQLRSPRRSESSSDRLDRLRRLTCRARLPARASVAVALPSTAGSIIAMTSVRVAAQR